MLLSFWGGYRQAAAVAVQPLAQELRYASGMALKRTRIANEKQVNIFGTTNFLTIKEGTVKYVKSKD